MKVVRKMAYSKSKRAVNRIRDMLDIIVNSEKSVVTFMSPEPSKFAYLIRQAIHSASYNDIPPYNHLAVKIIETENMVEVHKMNYGYATPLEMVFPDVKNLSQLMLAVTNNKLVKEFKFPNASLNELESELFLIWKTANNLIGDSNFLTRIDKDGKEGER